MEQTYDQLNNLISIHKSANERSLNKYIQSLLGYDDTVCAQRLPEPTVLAALSLMVATQPINAVSYLLGEESGVTH